MKMIKNINTIAVLSLFVCGSSMAEFVAIGGAGNSADSTGYGAVGYEFQISKTEVTYDEYQLSGIGGGNDSGLGGTAPVASVSWNQAARYCNWLTSGDTTIGAYSIGAGDKVDGVTAHNGLAMDALVSSHGVVYVLPTEDEWYKAAYYTGSGYSLFQNGTSTAPALGDAVYGGLGSPDTVGTGALEQNGTFDMGGNLQEWIEDATAGGEALDFNNDSQDMALRGGAYWSNATGLRSDGSRFSYPPFIIRDGNSSDTGFRMVAIPEPGTISLMSLSTVGLFLTRTVRRRKRLGRTVMPIRRTPLCDSFLSEQEWCCETIEVEEITEEQGLLAQCAAYISERMARISAAYREIEKSFWNRMVKRYENRMERRKNRLLLFKKNAIHRLDEFLALIMK